MFELAAAVSNNSLFAQVRPLRPAARLKQYKRHNP